MNDPSFYEKPVQCQISIMESDGSGFDDLHPSKYSIEKLILTDSKLPGINLTPSGNSPSDNILTYAKKATYKSEKSKSSFTKADERDIGQAGYVEIGDLWDRDKLSAEFGTIQETKQEKLSDAKDEVIERLKNKDCLNALGGTKKVKAALKKWKLQITDKGFLANENGGTALALTYRSGLTQVNNRGGLLDDKATKTTLPSDASEIDGRTENVLTLGGGNVLKVFKGDLTFRAFVLLHELGHITGASVKDYFQKGKTQTEKEAEKTMQAQEKNNDNILNNCFTETAHVGSQTAILVVE